MFKKTQRLSRKEFEEHFAAGKRYHSSHLTLIYVPGENFHGAVVVGKKVSKKAVDRNRLRRRIYGRLYTLFKTQSLSGVYIILTKPSALSLGSEALTAAITQLVGLVQKSR